MFTFSIYSTEIPRGKFGAAHCWLLSCVWNARPRSAAQGQLEATLISFADPGGQCIEAGRGKWGLTKLRLSTITFKSRAGARDYE